MIISEALSGNRIPVDNPESFLSLDDVKKLVNEKFGIPAENQLLLVARTASPLTLKLVADGQQIFVYDQRFFFGQNPPDIQYSESSELNNIKSPDVEPDVPKDNRRRLEWAQAYLASTAEMYSRLGVISQQTSTIQQGKSIALNYVKSYINVVEKFVNRKLQRTKELNEDIDCTLEQWRGAYERLKDFTDFEKQAPENSDSKDKKPSLQNRFDVKKLEKYAHECQEALPIMCKRMYELDESVSKVSGSFKKIFEKSSESVSTVQMAQLKDILDDVKAVYEKLKKDIEFIETPEGANHKERLEHLHEQEFLKTFPARWKEMHEFVNPAETDRKKAFTSCYNVLASIHDITARDFYSKINEFGSFLQKIEDSRVIVAQVIDMPYLYGLVLIEEQHRNDWVDSIRQTTSSMAEQFADIRTREMERRQLALKEIQLPLELDQILNVGDSELPQMEISLGNIRKYDVNTTIVKRHLEQLQKSGLNEEYEDLQERTNSEIDTSCPQRFNGPTASQQTQVIYNYEQRIKGYELRIKKLEDLLHRKHQLEGSPSGANSSLVTQSKSIERIHELEEKHAKDEVDNLNLQKKIKELEQTIQSQAATIAHNDSVKSDLLANMKNKEGEFASERKCLSEEVRTLKTRVDTMESEIDSGGQEINHLQGLLEEAMSSLSELSNSQTRLQDKCQDLSQKLYTTYVRSNEVLNTMGLQATKDEEGNYRVNRVKGLRKSGILNIEPEPPASLYWMNNDETKEEDDYAKFVNHVHIDYDMYRDSIGKRFGDVEHLARKLQKELKSIRTQQQDYQNGGINQNDKYKIALNNFKVGDLALFLPTKEDTRSLRPWAAFNIGAPHYFLKQTPAQNLDTREYLVARISKIEERVVNKSSEDDSIQNPFDLSDGLKWHYLEVSE